MIALLGSSLLNLGIIFLIFSVIIYIVKNKLSDMDKKITSLSTIMEETIKSINTHSTTTRVTPTDDKLEKPVVSDDENSDDEDSDDDDESYKQFSSATDNRDALLKNNKDDDKHYDEDDDDDEYYDKDDDAYDKKVVVKESLNNKVDYTHLTQDIEPLLDEVNLLQSKSDVDPVLGMTFQSYDSIDDNITDLSHVDGFNNTPEPGVFKEKEEEDYNLLNVKELKKLVSGKGGKVSGKTKDELILYLNENKE